MRRVSIVFLVAGSLAAFAGTLVPDPDTSDHPGAPRALRRVRAAGRDPDRLAPAAGRRARVGARDRPADRLRRGRGRPPARDDADLRAARAARRPRTSAPPRRVAFDLRRLRHRARRGARPLVRARGPHRGLDRHDDPRHCVTVVVVRSSAGSTRTSTACAASPRPTRSPALLNHGAFGAALDPRSTLPRHGRARDAAAARHRPLQAGQRPLRPSAGRPDAAARGRRCSPGTSAATTCSAGSAATSSRCCSSTPTWTSAHASPSGSATPSAARPPTRPARSPQHRHRRASPATPASPRRCSAPPTARCTPPRSTGATAPWPLEGLQPALA